MQRLLERVGVGMSHEHRRAIYPELLKRLDDSSNQVQGGEGEGGCKRASLAQPPPSQPHMTPHDMPVLPPSPPPYTHILPAPPPLTLPLCPLLLLRCASRRVVPSLPLPPPWATTTATQTRPTWYRSVGGWVGGEGHPSQGPI